MGATVHQRYQVIEDWEQLPRGFTHADCVGVGVDARDNVYLLTRNQSRVIVYSREGAFLRAWGEDLFTARTHGLTVGPDGRVYCVDDGSHCVYVFTPSGELLTTIGSKGIAADTGYDGHTLASIRGGPPFNRPTNLAVAPNGDLYVTDGYGNCKVHRFSPGGELIQSWGEPGSGPGQFILPHGIRVSGDGRVWVADRENDRMQIFTADGRFLEQWTDVQRPTNLAFDGAGNIYVSELWWQVGQRSAAHGEIVVDLPGRVSVFDATGRLLDRWGSADRCAPGNFAAPHDVCVDAHGDLYVAEVTETFAVRPGLVPPDCHTFQKFRRVDGAGGT
ncbi:MAG TPA: peptidyl-alpha-hydroxyglycine alpha-amidating lyase family protein [Chloroflexota bacterium]|jgi:DNA-binding beta-propeller fold protein YncE|nr:peptidyl-alpha-hydroxyglycine alpha-amidating lyase family protein [Chloroflexota bacterium]